MTIPFGIRLKLDRAHEHFLAVNEEIGRYLDSQPYKIVSNVQPSDQHLVLFEFHVISEPPLRFGVILGDYIQNIRTALDYLACELVIKNGGAVNVKTQFPILDCRPKDERGQPKLPKIHGGVAPNVLTIIESLQPYTRGKDALHHPLSILGHLSDIDKHRFLHTTVACIKNPHCFLTLSDGTKLGGESSVGVAYHETPIAAFKFPQPISSPSFDRNMQVEAYGSAFVAIKEVEPWRDKPIMLLMKEIDDFVRNDVMVKLLTFLD
jgi:hypothetical protein